MSMHSTKSGEEEKRGLYAHTVALMWKYSVANIFHFVLYKVGKELLK